jgi:hypothetical protein
MKQFKICIVKGSNNIIKEFENYKWETRRGEPTGKPIDDHNHGIDGTRYYTKGNLMRNRSNKDRTGQTSFTL